MSKSEPTPRVQAASDGPRIIHPQEHAALPCPTNTPPALTGSGPLSNAESEPNPSHKGGGAQNAAGGAVLPTSEVERELRALVASLTEERDFERIRCSALEDGCNLLQRERDAAVAERDEMKRAWAMEVASRNERESENATLLHENDLLLAEGERARAQRDKYLAAWGVAEKERDQAREAEKIIRTAFDARIGAAEKERDVAVAERDASRRAEADADRTLEEVRATLLAERAQHEEFMRAFRFPADAHPLIASLMESMVRVMGMEAAGGACNPHAVVCAAVDAAHSFAEQDGSPATAKLRDIVRVSAADVQGMKVRDQDAAYTRAELGYQRELVDALIAQIQDAAGKKARRRAEKVARRKTMEGVWSWASEDEDEPPLED